MTGSPFQFSLQPVPDFRCHWVDHAEGTPAQTTCARKEPLTLRPRTRGDHRSAEASTELASLDKQAIRVCSRPAAALS
jgi:hypothetical protein